MMDSILSFIVLVALFVIPGIFLAWTIHINNKRVKYYNQMIKEYQDRIRERHEKWKKDNKDTIEGYEG